MPHHAAPSPCTLPPDTLAQAVIARGFATGHAHWIPLRGGRSNRLWHVTNPVAPAARDCPSGWVVKLFAPQQNNPLFANDAHRETQLLTHLDGQDIAPRLQAYLSPPAGEAIIYEHLDGAIWQGNPAPVAALLHRLHGLPAPERLALPHAADGSVELLRQIRTILEACPEQIQNTLTPELKTLAARRDIPASGAMRLLHGDPVAGNLIDTSNGLRLIDWQCPALGDPCEDIAHFLSPAQQLVYRGSPLSRGETEEFLAAYCDRKTTARYTRLAPWYHARMAAYCGWKMAQGAQDYGPAFTLEHVALKAALT